ncbi:MAG: hypothetical protein HYV07_05340 [Deltaproteobacteria bacterium]|nr:hypothetical protein [Deltaproteobacteria bacterium]
MLERRIWVAPPHKRRALGLLLAVLTACAKENLAQQLPEFEANEILVVLEEAGVAAEKSRSIGSRELAFDVMVAKTDANAAYRVLREENLPRQKQQGLDKTLGEGGLIPTTEAELAKHKIGVQGDIVNKLRSLPGVIDVQAEVSIPKDDPLRDVNEAKERPKASVIIVYRPLGDNEVPLPVEAVQNFVQSSLPALKRSDVTVHMMPKVSARRAVTNPDGTPGALMPAGSGCEPTSFLNVEVCVSSKGKLRNLIFGSVVFSFVIAGLAVVATLRAMRYRKDLTRLTAQFNAAGRK